MSDMGLAVMIAAIVWCFDGGAGHVLALLLLVAFVRGL